MKKIFLLSLCCAAFLYGNDSSGNKNQTEITLNGLTLGASVSLFNAKSHETLYMPQGYATAGRRVSELTWKAKNIPLLGLNAEYEFYKGLGVYFGYQKDAFGDDGVMDDYDWISNTYPNVRTHWSHHENTKVDKIEVLDFGMKYKYTFDDVQMDTVSNVDTWIKLGYTQEKQKFQAYDGYGEYLLSPVSFSGLVITYEQEYKGPYLGLGADFKNEQYTFNIGMKYSPIMKAEYTDRHHQRIPAFTEDADFDNITMIGVNVGVGYKITQNQALTLSYEYTKYDDKKGDRIRRFDDGTVYNWPNATGIDSESNVVQLEYTYKF